MCVLEKEKENYNVMSAFKKPECKIIHVIWLQLGKNSQHTKETAGSLENKTAV